MDGVAEENAEVFPAALPFRELDQAPGQEVELKELPDFSDLTLVDELLGLEVADAAALGKHRGNQDAVPAAFLDDPVTEFHGMRHGLFDHDVLAGADRRQGLLSVQEMRRLDEHPVDVVPGDERLDGLFPADAVLGGDFLGGGLVDIRHGFNRGSLDEFGDGFDLGLPHETAPDNTDTEFFHISS